MTDRIQELAAEAKNKVPAGLEVSQWIEVYNTELAKLVIEDICDLISNNEFNLLPTHMHRMSAYAEVEMIKQHFGVE